MSLFMHRRPNRDSHYCRSVRLDLASSVHMHQPLEGINLIQTHGIPYLCHLKTFASLYCSSCDAYFIAFRTTAMACTFEATLEALCTNNCVRQRRWSSAPYSNMCCIA